ncbi:ABC transporter permease [Bacillus luteolus]|uniref:ABC transporter permease n=1 Tax=Litchfieldia luteola TaxID=682179 RepID=A0ABR9QDF9_9BACI|nr:ABC transporter permease [Cytobacillus luteolus]MBE4906528.1 ABC transporter permease [Cytobacillus luteolus]MBP1941212.1 ABC-2 type transport system permease protein [Cytobacillus luteolus]
MRNALKVAKWEIKRNMKNKSFLIGLFLTPLLFLGFMLIGSLFGDSEQKEEPASRVLINDNIGVFDTLEETVLALELNVELEKTDKAKEVVVEELEKVENTAYILLEQSSYESGILSVYTSEDMNPNFMSQVQAFAAPIKMVQMQQLGLSDEEMTAISKGIVFEEASFKEEGIHEGSDKTVGVNSFERIVPGAFAGIILLSIIFSGMYIFQSASQEKKDKVAEIILSSLTPSELMQGKIIGYFGLGMIQAVVYLSFGLPIALWKLDIPLFEYLLVPEVLLYIAIAILGYFLFAAIFVGVGATMADMSSAGNFQGLVMMLPFLPFVFIGPVISDPSGVLAQVGTYIPFSAPGVLLIRLTLLESWPLVEIAISLAILLVSIWIFMKLAGKIFKVGILMYGKNATPKEMLKWLRA